MAFDVKARDCVHGSEKIGLLPCGGRAVRLGPLPCSKEIFPIGFAPAGPDQAMQVRVPATGLLKSMRRAGAERAFVVLRNGKWDIPGYYGHGKAVGMDLAYLVMNHPYGAPYTLDQAYPFVRNATILFGFPDILFQPGDAFVQLLARQAETAAPIVLGIFRAANPSKMDMLKFDSRGRVSDIVIKPAQTELTHTWILAVWNPRFSRYLHDYVAADLQRRKTSLLDGDCPELYVGDVIRAAIKDNWSVETLCFDQGDYLDVGTPEDMQSAVSNPCWIREGEK